MKTEKGAALEFNDLLAKHDIPANTVLIFRHRPREPSLRRVLGSLAANNPVLFNAYQQSQYPQAEAAMQKADFVASFVGDEPGYATFVGLYRRGESIPLTMSEFWARQENQALQKLGMVGVSDDREITLWFDLQLQTHFYSEWKGRLKVRWPGGERSWWRWAERNQLLIDSILPKSSLEPEMPNWQELTLPMQELRSLPVSWRNALEHWRGIYLITDRSSGKQYVGSAYGAENLLGRWSSYAATGHGNNIELRACDPEGFEFSILQRVSPDMEAEELIRLEESWKKRLHTREFGLNRN